MYELIRNSATTSVAMMTPLENFGWELMPMR